MTVSGFHDIQDELNLPDHLVKILDQQDYCTFVVGRWFQPYEYVFERDELYRPICPGPLRINHCLWKYAVTRTPRRTLVNADGTRTEAFLSQRNYFGKSPRQQNLCYEHEKRAYFGLMNPHEIIGTNNMCPVFKDGTAEFNQSTWLETVTAL